MATLVSVNVGMPQHVDWQGRDVYTGIWKHSVPGPRMVRRLNVDGDGQGDLNGHGGEQRAVLVYQLDSYRFWQDLFGRDDFEYGQFGENFTVDGLADNEVCVGDRYRIGEAEFEVTQPRVTCYRVGMRLGEPRLPALLVAHHRPGFYLRVLTEGEVQPGDTIERTQRGRHQLSVADVDALLYLPHRDVEQLRKATDLPALSPGWQQSFRELLEATDVPGPQTEATSGGSPAGIAAVDSRPPWAAFRELTAERVVHETQSVASVYLAARAGEALPPFLAGQYLTIRAPQLDTPAPVRSYSISSSPSARTYRISVKREPDGLMSAFVHTGLKPGAAIEVASPRGLFVLDRADNPVLLVSAGIGVTPVLAMLHELVDGGSTRDVWWIHTTRNLRQHAFAEEAHQLLQQLPRAHERIFYTSSDTHPPANRPVICGRPTLAALAGLSLPTSATVYLCGPAPFMAEMEGMLAGVGIGRDRIHTETFGGQGPMNPGVASSSPAAPHQPLLPAPSGPMVTFARSGLATRLGEGRQTLLELAEACDVPTRWSCRTGVCHTCAAPLVAGEVEYTTPPLEMPAETEVLLCCARARTDVVLDM